MTRGRIAFAMGLFGVTFIVATFGYIALEQRSRLMQRNDEEIVSNAYFMADHAARLFEVTDLTLRQATAFIEGQSWAAIEPSRAYWEQLNAIKSALPYVDDIWLNDSTGKLRLTSALFPTPDSSVADRDAFREQAASDKGLYVGEPIIGRITSAPTFLVSRRLESPTGQFRGIVSVTMALSYFNDYWGNLRLPKRSRIALMRASDGKIIAQYPSPTDGVSLVASDGAAFRAAVATNGRVGSFAYDAADDPRLAAYHQVGDMPLYVGISVPQDTYWTAWITQTRLYGAFALIAFLALAALTALAGRQFREQAADAALLSEEVALRTGELQAETAALEVLNRTGTTLASELEIDHIMHNVIDAGVELTDAEAGAFYDRYPAGGVSGREGAFKLCAVAGAGEQVFANAPTLQDAQALSPTLALGKIVRADDIMADGGDDRESLFRAISSGPIVMRSAMAVPVVSRTGDINGVLMFAHRNTQVFTERSERLMQGLAAQAAIAIENGRLYQAAQYEIEERKQSQAQQSLLIRELHHRVKNTLATVQAVVGATARSTTNIDDFYQAFVARIISLANTHSLLTEAVWQTASLREILEKELTPYYDPAGERIRIDGPLVELPSEAAVPIGMAIHELTTNATKYGALSVEGGRVAVSWSSEPEGDGIRLNLIWTERNGPVVSPPTRQGFGSRLLHRVLTTQLSAAVDMDFDPEGLRVSLDMVLKQGAFLNPVA